MELGILGPLVVVGEEGRVAISSLKERAVVTALALRPSAPVPAGRLTELVWGDEPPPSARSTLRSLISRLRRTLGDAVLLSESGGAAYRLGVAPAEVDAERFAQGLAAGKRAYGRGELGEAERLLGRALAEWRGDPLLDVADCAVAAGERARLSEMRLEAVELGVDVGLALGRHGELVAELEAHLAEQPMRERFWEQLMVALYRAGRQSEALRAYQRARRALVDELGVEPALPLRELEAAILAQDPSLHFPLPCGAPPAEQRARPTVPRENADPPLRGAGAVPGNLPLPLTDFVGRQQELDSLVGAVTEHRLVTISGTGGSGKTRLALELGEAMGHRFSGGVWMIELAALENGGGIAHAVLASLGAKTMVDASCGELVHDVLAGRPALLVLDNVEHVLDAAVDLVENLLRGAPEVRLLLTSRQPLGIPSEQVHPLGPLRPAEQVQLFNRRAAAATGRPPIGDDDLVARICRELDGLPLAIELAAARLRSMTLTELAERLPQRFRLLANTRAGPPRHRSLEALVTWSFDQLTVSEQRFFARLSAFLGDFDVAAARTVAGEEQLDEVECLALLDALVDKSLVLRSERSGRSRYSLLETLRQFGEARLADAERDLRARHARYYVALLAELRRRSPATGAGSLVELIASELPNIRAAFQWLRSGGEADLCLRIVGELTAYAQLHPNLEVAEWAEQALALSAGEVSPRTVRAHLAASMVSTHLADWQGGERHARAALAHDEQLGGAMRASALCSLSPPVCFQGRTAEAHAIAREAFLHAERNGRPVVIAAARHLRLQSSLYTGARPTMSDLASWRELAQQPDVPAVRTYILLSQGVAAMLLHEPEAAPVLREAAAVADTVGARQLGCLCRGYLALAEAGGDPRSGLRALRVALVDHRAARVPFGYRQFAAELLHLFAPLQRWATIAVLDGAAPPVSIFPEAARHAKQLARRELGADRFEASAARGRRMLHDEFESFLHDELDLLGVEQYVSTLPY